MLAAGLSPFAAMPLLVVLALTRGPMSMLSLLLHLSIVGFMGTLYVLGRHPRPRFEGSRVSVLDGVLSVDGATVASKDDLKQGVVAPRGTDTWVRLDRRGRGLPIQIRVADVAESRALLRALGFDATQTTAELRCMTPVVTKPVATQAAFWLPALGLIFGSLALGGLIGRSIGPIAVVVGVALMLAYVFGIVMAPTRVRIGADGIATRWLGRARFYPFADIERVDDWSERVGTKEYRGIVIHERSGKTTKIAAGQKGWNDAAVEPLRHRVTEALEAYRSGVRSADVSVLARSGRDDTDWVRHLVALGVGATADLRRGFVPADQLLRVVEDASQPPLARAGAAIAVAGTADEPTRARIRVAAKTTASPTLRVAMERALDAETLEAESEVTAVAEALRALEEGATQERVK